MHTKPHPLVHPSTSQQQVDLTETTPAIEKKQKQQQQQKQDVRKKQNKQEPDQKSKNEPQHRAKKTEKGTPKKPRPSIIVTGDSMIKNIKGWLMSRRKPVHTYSFPGATTEDMEFFLKPLIARKPEEIVLHIGTNDLSSYSAEQVTGNIMKLTAEVEKHNIKCTVSSIIIQKGELSSKVH